MPANDPDGGPGSSGYAALKHRDFTYFWAARIFNGLALDMQIVAVGWQVFSLTGRPLDLGFVGLVQFAPFPFLFLISGIVADKLPRKFILAAATATQVAAASLLLIITVTGNASVPIILPVLFLLGAARAFQAPAQQAIVPNLVPKETFANAVAWNSTGFQVSKIVGPAIGGFILIAGTEFVYATVVVCLIASLTSVLMIKAETQIINKDRPSVDTILAGFRFIWRRQTILGVISLDLFAVILGGVTALLPIFAKDILFVGASGFGVLRAAPAIGALVCAAFLLTHPIRRHAGLKLLGTVALFGFAIIAFGLSTNFWLSMAVLIALGGFDMISVFIRNNLTQVITPDDMRGRVSAVSSVFVGATNELGEFESGITAAWWGTVPAVLVGGIGTVLVAISFIRIFPELRKIDSLDPEDLIRRYRYPPPADQS